MRQICIAAALMVACSGVCSAIPVVFANFQSPSPDHGAVGTNGGGNNETITFTGTVEFEFENVGSFLPPGVQNDQQVLANIAETFTSNTNGQQFLGTLDAVSGWSGNIAVTLTTAESLAICGHVPGCSNLLTVTFADTSGTNNVLSATAGGTSSTMQASEPPNATADVVFSSDFLNFSAEILESFSLSLLSSNPIALTGGTSGPFIPNDYDITGQFQEAPGFSPEPGTMVLMGGALLGLSVFGRKRLFR